MGQAISQAAHEPRTGGALRMQVVVARTAQELAPHIAAWEDLAAHALEQNVFYEHWMVLPALKSVGEDCDLQFVLIFACDAERSQLTGIFPLERARRYRQAPVTVLRLWKYLFSALCTPLIRREHARETLAAFFGWVESAAAASALCEFCYVEGEGPFAQLLIDHLKEHKKLSVVTECFTRALFKPRGDTDEYLRAAISGRHIKEMRRKRNRLAESGKLRAAVLQLDDDPMPWIEQFLRLESSGWKGEQGTAFASSPESREFFIAVAREAFHRGRLMMLALLVDGKPIAMKCNFLAGQGAFAFKIAYDESYARFSPGVLLEVENIRLLHSAPGILWMDSCAIATHPMINRLWLDRKIIQTVLVDTGRMMGSFIVAVLPLARWAKRNLFDRAFSLRRRRQDGEATEVGL